MANISRQRLNQYRSELNALDDDARRYMRAKLAEVIYSGDLATIRKTAITAIAEINETYGEGAKFLANEFLEEILSLPTKYYNVIDIDEQQKKIRWAVGQEKALAHIEKLAGYAVKRSAFENLRMNCELNGVKYARIPTGLETCGFCFMLASRGFVYNSAGLAGLNGGYHSNCDCVIVPQKEGLDDDMQVEGYYPSELKEKYKQARLLFNEDCIKQDVTFEDEKEQIKAMCRYFTSLGNEYLYNGNTTV